MASYLVTGSADFNSYKKFVTPIKICVDDYLQYYLTTADAYL